MSVPGPGPGFRSGKYREVSPGDLIIRVIVHGTLQAAANRRFVIRSEIRFFGSNPEVFGEDAKAVEYFRWRQALV
jgi:hypothetical protein